MGRGWPSSYAGQASDSDLRQQVRLSSSSLQGAGRGGHTEEEAGAPQVPGVGVGL